MVPALNSIPGVRCTNPAGAFYVFPNVEGALRDLGVLDWFDRLPETKRQSSSPTTLFQMFALYHHQLAVMDRRSFGLIGSEGQHYLRLSIAADLETLREGIHRLQTALTDRAGFESFMRAARDY